MLPVSSIHEQSPLSHQPLDVVVFLNRDCRCHETRFQELASEHNNRQTPFRQLLSSVMMRTRTPPLETLQSAGEIRHAKGRFLNSGNSGILEVLPSGDVMKSPWPGQNGVESRRELSTENEIYCTLGPHSRLVKIMEWNARDCSLTMEYMLL